MGMRGPACSAECHAQNQITFIFKAEVIARVIVLLSSTLTSFHSLIAASSIPLSHFWISAARGVLVRVSLLEFW